MGQVWMVKREGTRGKAVGGRVVVLRTCRKRSEGNVFPVAI